MTAGSPRVRGARAALIVAGVALVAACTARDDAAVVDSSAISLPADSTAQAVVPTPIPAAPDSAALPVAPPADMPPVAGETKKPSPTDRRERDSVVAPVLEVGPDGKVRPIKK